MQTIKMTFKGPKAKIEVDGCQDASCAELTAAIEKALGVAESVNHKPEYYQETQQGQQQCQ